jgi:hypothetical protein
MLVPPGSPTPPSIHGWGFLDWWSFIGTLATLVGLIFALIGLYVAVKQIKKTISAAIASTNTARNIWHQQLSRRLGDLKESCERIDKCAHGDNREEMCSLLSEWMQLASEAYGMVERFIFPRPSAGTDFRSDLGLNENDNPSERPMAPSYGQLATKLNGSISATKTALSQVETARRSRALTNLTRSCREMISDVVVESARFQVGLSTQMTIERTFDRGT